MTTFILHGVSSVWFLHKRFGIKFDGPGVHLHLALALPWAPSVPHYYYRISYMNVRMCRARCSAKDAMSAGTHRLCNTPFRIQPIYEYICAVCFSFYLHIIYCSMFLLLLQYYIYIIYREDGEDTLTPQFSPLPHGTTIIWSCFVARTFWLMHKGRQCTVNSYVNSHPSNKSQLRQGTLFDTLERNEKTTDDLAAKNRSVKEYGMCLFLGLTYFTLFSLFKVLHLFFFLNKIQR